MKIPKGGLHNINQSSQANINDSWNVLATDEQNAVLIAVDKCGTKKTVGDTTEIKNSIQALEQENIEQDNRLNLVEQENQNQNTLISELIDDVTNLEGIHYTWSPTNRTLTLYDNNGNQLSQVSLQSLDNEGTDLRYNASTLSLELYNADNELLDSIPVSSFIGSVGTQLQLNSNQLQLKDSQGNILSTVSFTVSNIQGLQTALDSKLNKGGYEGTAQDLKNEIDNVQIGGRNYYKKDSTIYSYNGITLQKNPGHFPDGIFVVGVANNAGWFRISNVIKSNGWWTVSWDMRGSQEGAYGVTVDICDVVTKRFTYPADNSWKRFSFSVNVTNYGDGSEFNFVDFQNLDWVEYYIKNIKIEKGNKATDWTPAPEDKQDILQDITGNIGVGKPDASATEKLDVNGNVKATGFKTPNGTSSQALTANGGTFDLTTKADLVGGKVPATQSQPSTIVMDNSTYVITFTDATSAVQTIDLPLQSLFQDANYDAATKSLIVTLQNGTIRTIPLTDLVDLPEIVLSTSNPAVTPTTGKKVYFNTDLGKVWFNAGGNWSGGYSLINTITTDVTSTTTVGAINAGDIIPAGTTIQGFVEKLLNKIYYPTYTPHSFSLTNNAGNKPKEVGSSFNITLTFNFNRGEILGKLVNNVWLEDEKQADKLGAATSYILNGVSGSNNSSSFNVTTVLGTNTFNGSVTYAIGAQPKDSKNNDFESPFPAGISPTQSTSFNGIYPYFYYKSTSPITPEIMQSAIANGQATKVIEDSTGTITIPFLPNGEYIAVAYPATSATKKKWYVTPLDNGDIPGGVLGVANTLPCNSPTNLWNNVNFKIHVSAGVLTQYEAVQLKNS